MPRLITTRVTRSFSVELRELAFSARSVHRRRDAFRRVDRIEDPFTGERFFFEYAEASAIEREAGGIGEPEGALWRAMVSDRSRRKPSRPRWSIE